MTIKERIAAWRQAFSDEENGIHSTLVRLAWKHATYLVVLKAFELSPETKTGKKQANDMLLELIADGYWPFMVLAIRRLTDKEKLEGQKGVYSLRSVIRDIRKHRDALNRKVFLEDISEQPYDYESIDLAHADFIRQSEPGVVWTPKHLISSESKRRHREFDFLSGVDSSRRNPEDLIQESIFDRLEERIKRLDKIADHATIYYAHAATASSRANRGLTEWGTEDAESALKIIAETAQLVGSWFLYSGIGDILPTPQYNQFEFIDKPFFCGEISELEKTWSNFAKRVSGWPYVEDVSL
jgi:hypothetical protein